MVYVYSRFTVKNAKGFINKYSDHDYIKKDLGCLNYKIFNNEDNENVFTCLSEWDKKENKDIYHNNYYQSVRDKWEIAYTEMHELILIDERLTDQSGGTASNFYVISRMNLTRTMELPENLAEEFRQTYPLETLRALNCESVQLFINHLNPNIVSIVSKWMDKTSYQIWYSSERRLEINKKADTLEKQHSIDHYQLRLRNSKDLTILSNGDLSKHLEISL